MNLDEVCDRVKIDDRGKHDVLATVQEISMEQGRLYWPGADDDGFGYALTPYAMGQACAKLGMPAGYFAKCPTKLQDDQFNWWKTLEGVEGMGRRRPGGDSPERWTLRAKDSTIRGVLSARYEKLDNRQLLDALLPAVAGMGHEVKLFNLTDESFHLRLIDPRMNRLVFPGDPLTVAIHLSNSEVGLRAVTVDACVFRQVCENGMVRKIAGRSLLKQRHIHLGNGRFVPLLQEAVAQATLLAAAFIEQMIFSSKTIVPDPEKAIESLADAWKLSKQTVEYIKFGLFGETHQDTLYGLVNAVTNAAQRLPVEGRYELETLASTLIDTTASSRIEAALRQRVLAPKGGAFV